MSACSPAVDGQSVDSPYQQINHLPPPQPPLNHPSSPRTLKPTQWLLPRSTILAKQLLFVLNVCLLARSRWAVNGQSIPTNQPPPPPQPPLNHPSSPRTLKPTQWLLPRSTILAKQLLFVLNVCLLARGRWLVNGQSIPINRPPPSTSTTPRPLKRSILLNDGFFILQSLPSSGQAV
jgi:hypothetical protein